MALFRKFFYRKPPDGLLEISEKVYVFDCCFTTDVLDEDEYKVYMGGIVAQLRDHFPNASFMVFNFREGERQSHLASVLSEYDVTVMDYPRHYEGCPLITMEMIHHFLRSSENWLSLGQQNLLLMHCERGGWPVLAFMLAGLLIYRKQYTGEQKTLDMIYKQAPRELLQLLSPLNPLPSQLRYLQYISRRNVGPDWPPLDRAVTLDCVILRMLPSFHGEGGCRPLFRIYGQDPFLATDRSVKVLFSTPKNSRTVRLYKQADCELVKIDIHCHAQGDVVLECITVDEDTDREVMMFRVMFNTAFIRSNILMLNRDEIDMLWDAKDRFPKDFRAEILFSDMDAADSLITVELPASDEKEGLPIEAFAKVQEIFSSVDWLDPKTDAALNVLQQINTSNYLQEKLGTGLIQNTELLPDIISDKLQEKLKPYSDGNLENSVSISPKRESVPSTKSLPDMDTTKIKVQHQGNVQPQELQAALQRSMHSKIITQMMRQSSLSPDSLSNSQQGSPLSMSRYNSAPSALGITALLHDHAAFGTADAAHLVGPPSVPASSPASDVSKLPKTASPKSNPTQLQPSPLASSPQAPIPSTPQPQAPMPSASQPQEPVPSTPQPLAAMPSAFQPQTPMTSTTQPQAPVPLASQPQTPVPSTTQSQAPTPSAIEPQVHELSSTHPQTSAPLATQPQTPASSTSQPQSPVPAATEPQAFVPSATQPKASVPPSLSPTRVPVPPPPPPMPQSSLEVDTTTSTMPSSQLHQPSSLPHPPPPPPPPLAVAAPISDANLKYSPPTPPPPPLAPFPSSTPPPPPPPLKNPTTTPGPPSPPPPPLSSRPSSYPTTVALVPPPPPPPPLAPAQAPPPPPPHAQAPPPPPPHAQAPPPPPLPPGHVPPPPPPPTQVPPSPQPPTQAPPPPPPPTLGSKSSASPAPPVPPPPAPFAKGDRKTGGPSAPPSPAPPIGAKGRGLSRSAGLKNQQSSKKTSLKPLHWLKLTRAMQGSLWAETQKPEEASKAPEFDMSELESLFSTAVPNSDRASKSNRRASLGTKSEKVQLVDLRRAYNCEIMLTKVKMPLPDLMSTVLALDDSALDVDQVDNLIKFCPTKEEMEMLKGYSGDKENLGKCEKFFLELMKVPRVESKLRVFSFKIQFRSQVSDLRRNLNIVNAAAEEIRNSAKLKRIMQTILSLGNALNQGTARGSAIGFRLDSLLKLTDTRARNNKMTLMHYLCKVLADKLPELLDFHKDLVSLEVATKIQLKYLAEEMQAISKGLEKVEQELTASENDGAISQAFCKTLKEFLGGAEAEVRSLASLYSGVGRNADALALYFGEDPARCPFEQVVSTLLNFVRTFGRAHDENCKQLEIEKKKAQKEAENEKAKIVAQQKESERINRTEIKNVEEI